MRRETATCRRREKENARKIMKMAQIKGEIIVRRRSS